MGASCSCVNQRTDTTRYGYLCDLFEHEAEHEKFKRLQSPNNTIQIFLFPARALVGTFLIGSSGHIEGLDVVASIRPQAVIFFQRLFGALAGTQITFQDQSDEFENAC
jgi:hypothetical protein